MRGRGGGEMDASGPDRDRWRHRDIGVTETRIWRGCLRQTEDETQMQITPRRTGLGTQALTEPPRPGEEERVWGDLSDSGHTCRLRMCSPCSALNEATICMDPGIGQERTLVLGIPSEGPSPPPHPLLLASSGLSSLPLSPTLPLSVPARDGDTLLPLSTNRGSPHFVIHYPTQGGPHAAYGLLLPARPLNPLAGETCRTVSPRGTSEEDKDTGR